MTPSEIAGVDMITSFAGPEHRRRSPGRDLVPSGAPSLFPGGRGEGGDEDAALLQL
jgi:hypothetical protein